MKSRYLEMRSKTNMTIEHLYFRLNQILSGHRTSKAHAMKYIKLHESLLKKSKQLAKYSDLFNDSLSSSDEFSLFFKNYEQSYDVKIKPRLYLYTCDSRSILKQIVIRELTNIRVRTSDTKKDISNLVVNEISSKMMKFGYTKNITKTTTTRFRQKVYRILELIDIYQASRSILLNPASRRKALVIRLNKRTQDILDRKLAKEKLPVGKK